MFSSVFNTVSFLVLMFVYVVAALIAYRYSPTMMKIADIAYEKEKTSKLNFILTIAFGIVVWWIALILDGYEKIMGRR